MCITANNGHILANPWFTNNSISTHSYNHSGRICSVRVSLVSFEFCLESWIKACLKLCVSCFVCHLSEVSSFGMKASYQPPICCWNSSQWLHQVCPPATCNCQSSTRNSIYKQMPSADTSPVWTGPSPAFVPHDWTQVQSWVRELCTATHHASSRMSHIKPIPN